MGIDYSDPATFELLDLEDDEAPVTWLEWLEDDYVAGVPVDVVLAKLSV